VATPRCEIRAHTVWPIRFLSVRSNGFEELEEDIMDILSRGDNMRTLTSDLQLQPTRTGDVSR
jgi:hypothetical protein